MNNSNSNSEEMDIIKGDEINTSYNLILHIKLLCE